MTRLVAGVVIVAAGGSCPVFEYSARAVKKAVVGYGQADKDQVAAAFKIITKDPNVQGIFVNIFGGIMRCDTIAEGIVAAVKEVGLEVPLVVRLEGTNVDLGKQILAESGLNLVSADDMKDGAQKILALAGGAA